jgi:hypothetical protein
LSAPVHWTQISPKIAANLPLDVLENDVVLPIVDFGFELPNNQCPWPWEPQQLAGAPMGQYHCSYCGSMECAGIPHSDLREYGKFNVEMGVWLEDYEFDDDPPNFNWPPTERDEISL